MDSGLRRNDEEKTLECPVTGALDTGALADAVARAEAHAPFLRRTLQRHPEIPDRLGAAGLSGVLAEARAASLAQRDVRAALRRERQVVALAVALADLAGIGLDAVVEALTAFADYAVERALTAIFAERTPDAPVTGFVALALGKQGSRELNYSSDIDPILLFDPASLPRRPREEPAEAAVRIARALVGFLQEPTGDGMVLRVDLRLRPASEATPLAVPIDAAIAHYESSALPWERAAFIKARPMAGDLALGADFLAHIRPFVWRRALDFGTLSEVRGLSRRIRAHHAQGQALGPGFDLKRGRGGIREIEFFAQIHQLIHGGRDPALRTPATRDALAALAEAGWIGAGEAADLSHAYIVLRTIEHRLQMVEDQQTHRLPRDQAALDGVARLSGLADGAALVEHLRSQVDRVGSLYDGLDPPSSEGLPVAEAGLAAHLAEAGFAQAEAGAARIERWRTGPVRTTRSDAAREALEAVLPPLIAALGQSPSPDTALARFDDLVSHLPSAINLFRLLEARPQLRALLAAILAHAPSLAADLARRASLLDGLIDASALAPPPAVPEIAGALGGSTDYQDLLDRVRLGVGERRFALGAQLIGGARDPIEVGKGYARVAEAALEVLTAATVAEFEAAHGNVPGGELVILALGRLGGGVLTHASDLDLVYLFTGDFLAESDGRRPLGATTYFNRLCQRVSAAMSVPTASGSLYEIDTRLRPSGNQGMLAVSLDSFARYEQENAWTWEHMALTRARPIFGSSEARAATQAVIDAALARPRDLPTLAAEAAKMRADITRHKPPAGAYDVKLVEGGLVDAEFAIHLLQLSSHIGVLPDLIAAAAALENAGFLAKGFGAAVALLQQMLIALRLIAPDGSCPPEPSRALMAQACRLADWKALESAYAQARALIAREWRRVAGLG
jgi:glutamate-ammonia-ligase adenylyltransferase